MCDLKNKNQLSPINFAILNSLFDMANLLISKYKVDAGQPGKDGNTLLHLASYYNKVEAIRYALKLGCNVNVKNNNWDTPLHIATTQQHKDAVQTLIAHKADLLALNQNNFFPLFEAIQTGNLEMVKFFEETATSIRNRNHELDPLHIAASIESCEILHYFLSKTPLLINITDNCDAKATPLHYSVLNKSYDCAQYLLRHGCKKNMQDQVGNTPLHLAVLKKDLRMCQLLCDYNVEVNLKNADNLTPIDLCYVDRDKLLINFFRSKS